MTTSRRPWREVLKVHPAADLFPLMSADELRELADDINKNGLQEPVTLVEDEARHLTGEQKRDLIAKLLLATPEWSNRLIAKLTDRDDKTVAAVRRELEATAEIPQLKKTVGAGGKARPTAKPTKTISAKIERHDAPARTIRAEITKSEERPLDLLAMFKSYAAHHLMALPINERTEMARRWRAHLDTAYLPDRSDATTVAEAARDIVH